MKTDTELEEVINSYWIRRGYLGIRTFRKKYILPGPGQLTTFTAIGSNIGHRGFPPKVPEPHSYPVVTPINTQT